MKPWSDSADLSKAWMEAAAEVLTQAIASVPPTADKHAIDCPGWRCRALRLLLCSNPDQWKSQQPKESDPEPTP